MSKYRNVSGEARSVALLHGRVVEADEVVDVPEHLSDPHFDWQQPGVWELVSESKSKKES